MGMTQEEIVEEFTRCVTQDGRIELPEITFEDGTASVVDMAMFLAEDGKISTLIARAMVLWAARHGDTSTAVATFVTNGLEQLQRIENRMN